MNFIDSEYHKWIEKAVADADLVPELKEMGDKEREDAFYRNLSFGTGGLRGIIGAGNNRINVYTVARASQGLSNYLNKKFDKPTVVIGYDTRIKSDIFAKVAAGVFVENGLRVHLWKEPLPVPTVSFAVRYLHASAGVMITASHNPAPYNGYKVYGSDGCQITTEAAAEIFAEIERVDIFASVINASPEVEYIGEPVLEAFLDDVKQQSVLYGDEIDRNVAIVYSPLNGTGFKPVMKTLSESGFTNITVVSEQKDPDGRFPTCPYPNPEIKEAMELGLQYCRKAGADLMLATDPDCDRCGIAVRDGEDYVLLTGNEVGVLLLDYVCSQRSRHGMMPEDPVFIKTIVTTDMAERIAKKYGVRTINVLTGFKFIGEQIGRLEDIGKTSSYICGFEESYGYLTGSYVRDKDAVNAAFMICEMFAFYKTRGVSLPDKLNDLYSEYGFCMNTLHSYTFEGAEGFVRMQSIMKNFRDGIEAIGNLKVKEVLDYNEGIDGLPKSDVLKYLLVDNSSVVVRPSGTEPKIKIYTSIASEDREKALIEEDKILKDLEKLFG